MHACIQLCPRTKEIVRQRGCNRYGYIEILGLRNDFVPSLHPPPHPHSILATVASAYGPSRSIAHSPPLPSSRVYLYRSCNLDGWPHQNSTSLFVSYSQDSRSSILRLSLVPFPSSTRGLGHMFLRSRPMDSRTRGISLGVTVYH